MMNILEAVEAFKKLRASDPVATPGGYTGISVFRSLDKKTTETLL